MLALLAGQADFIVLARYMRILSADFVTHYPQRIINIHHSFLPAFVGADPYQQAYVRGVKLIGATAHYVTKSEEHTSELQSLMRISYAVFCLKKKTIHSTTHL